MSTPTARPGFAPAPVNSTQWNAQVIEANAQAQQDATAYRAQASKSDLDMIPDWIKTPVEWVGAGVHSIYSNVVARPITTAFIATELGGAQAKGASQAWGNLFNGDIWDQAYKDSEHVSPGQAISFGITHLFDTNEELKSALMKPVDYKPKDMYGKPAVDSNGKPINVNLNSTGYLWDNPDAVAQYYDSGAQKYISGGLDAAIGWYGDPLAKFGKVLGVARDLAYVRPAAQTTQKTFIGTARQAVLGKPLGQFEGGEKVVTSNVAKNLQGSAFNSMGDLIMKQKGILGKPTLGPIGPGASSGSASTFEDWATRQNWAKNSPNGAALAAALGKATDRQEVDHILAIGMGDEGAIQALTAKNAELGAQMTMLDRQRKGLVTNFPANPNPTQALQQSQQLEDLAQQMNAITTQSSAIGDKLALQSSLKNGMYYTPGISPLASNFGQYVRGLGTASRGDFRPGLGLIYNNLYVRPLRVATGATLNAIRAPGHIDVYADDSHRALDATLDQSKAWSPAERQLLTSKYLAANAADRGTLLDVIDRTTTGRIAQKYGLTDNQAGSLYAAIGGLKGQAKDGRVYSAARIDTATGGSIRVDHVDDAGNAIAVSPILSTQLENTHVMTDFDHLNKVLKFNAGAFKKLFNEEELRTRAGVMGPTSPGDLQQAQQAALQGLPSTVMNKAYRASNMGAAGLDLMGRMWKFNVLLRLGYGPRAIADDFMGQAARLGAWNLFAERTLGGGRNMANRVANRIMGDPTGYQQQMASLDSGIQQLTEHSANMQAKIDNINSYLPPATNYTGKGAKGRAQFNARTTNLAQYQQRLNDAQETLEGLKARRNQLGATKAKLGDSYEIMPDGTAFPRPYEGPQGALFKDLNAGRRTIDSIMGGTADESWNYYRSGNWQVVENSAPNHLSSWLKDVQYQIANDPAAMQIVKGGNAADLEKWFSSTAGRQYRADFPKLQNMDDAEHADRIAAHVDHYLPTHTPEAVGLRRAVAEGADDKTVRDMMGKVQQVDRPAVQSEGLAYAMGKSDIVQHMDNVMTGWYKWANQLPAEVLSRNPLFFQLYRQHVKELWNNADAQGVSKLTPARQQAITEKARQFALKDVKRFTFNMDFEGKLAYKLRFVAPFFGPTQESFQRWGRIIADKPDVIAHAANIYTSPIRAGHAVNQDGQPVDQDGYTHNPDGSKTLVPKDQMHIQFQVPAWAQKGLGMDGGSVVDMPINTLNLVLQNDPWFNPGMGPIVQVPSNWAALRADPKVGDTLKSLGVLQSVQQNPLSQVTGSMPKFLNQLVAGDPDQERKDMIQIMQAENYKFQNGMRDKEPTWQEVKDRAQHGADMRAFFKTVLPVSASFKDPYQFFRDRYQELQQANPKTADQIFLAKYGDAAFSFTGALTKSAKGLPSTREAVLADQKYAYLTNENPELAALITGQYGHGDAFSQTAYAQQLASGDRKPLDPQASMNQAKANLGWAQFQKYMNTISAGLYQAGFKSFQDKGAEVYNNQRKAVLGVLTSPFLPDGVTKNPLYNDQFDEQYNTVDKNKDDRQALAMKKVVTEASLVNDPMRQDIKGLANYMILRDSAKQILAERKKQGGSNDLGAKQNADILQGFHDSVMNLIESNTKFQSLHDRFLTHDMFNHYDPGLSQNGA